MNENRVPDHVAIIMDGNGRWAKSRGLPRTEGHRRGLESAKAIVKTARDEGIKFLSLYTFSTENWKRASEEVGFLMSLLRTHLSRELDFYRQHQIRIVHSGAREGLPSDVLAEIDRAVSDTADFKGIVVNLAINYGGRDEIARAVRKLPPGLADEAAIRSFLDHPEIPDPDFIIRTGGEYRLSNFLLWQSAYSELYFSPKFWPDFTPEDLREALRDYAHRERRFGDAR
jgi:undecaprenyl diphosphate synthase